MVSLGMAKQNLSPEAKEKKRLRNREWYRKNKDRAAETLHIWKVRNPEKYAKFNTTEYKSQSNRKYRYGINFNRYMELYTSQDGKCAICGISASELPRNLAVDHCHKTGKIRALLCGRCNMGLGYFKDNTDLLQNAALYLTKFK